MESSDLTTFLLEVVRIKPEMFLINDQLTSLKIFLSGYQFGIWNNNPSVEDRFFLHFNDWLIKKTKAAHHETWYHKILEECNKSEEKGLSRFWEYLELFDKDYKSVVN